MRRLFVLAAVVLVAGGMSDGHLHAPPQPPLSFADHTGSSQGSALVEKQTWWVTSGTPDPSHTIVNSFAGTWDINEHFDWYTGPGYLDPAGSASTSWRHAWDWNPIWSCRLGICADWGGVSNYTETYVRAPSPDLVVSVCFQGRCWQPAATWNSTSREYDYTYCGQAVYTENDPALVDIPGSQALDGTYGRGAPSTITLTVANPTGRMVKSISVSWGVSSDQVRGPGCSTNGWGTSTGIVPIAGSDYPFRWSSS